MGRLRNKKDRWMPPRVYRGKTKYELHPAKGGSISLCPLDATESEVWQAYRDSQKKAILSCQDLADKYFASTNFQKKKPKTRKNYLLSWNSLAKVFDTVDATKMRPLHVRKYMDARGVQGEVAANRDMALLQNIFAYGYERGLVKLNPCIGVKKFSETPRDYYIEDSEYEQFLALSTPIVQVFMELSYLEAARGQDVRVIMLSDIKDDGIFIQQEKTGKKQIKLWTPRLLDAVEHAKAIRKQISDKRKGKVVSLYLVVNERGQPYTESGLKSVWRNNKKRIKDEHGIDIEWTFHDIKAKGISDYEGNKQDFANHADPRMTDRYNRKTRRVLAHDTAARPLQKG
jgi:integrase